MVIFARNALHEDGEQVLSTATYPRSDTLNYWAEVKAAFALLLATDELVPTVKNLIASFSFIKTSLL